MNKRGVKRNTDSLLSIKDAFDLYQNERRAKGCVKSTIDNSEFALKIFLADMNLSEEDALSHISKSSIEQWSIFMQKTDKSCETISAYLSRMRGFVNFCIRNDYIEPFRINMPNNQEEKIKFFSDYELEILTKKPDKNSSFREYRTWLINCFILSTGARASTISNIKWEDIDFRTREVTYTHLKNKSLAIIPLCASICALLIDYKKTWTTNSEYVFCDVGGGKLTPSAMRQSLAVYCKNRGITPRGPHSLRHNFSRGWIQAGGNSFQLQQMLCHTDLTMTKKYVRLFSNDIDVEAYNPLDVIRKGKSRTKRVHKN